MPETRQRKLTQNQQRWIIKRLTLNMHYKELQANFEAKFDRTVSSVTLTRLRGKHSIAITTHQAAIVEAGAVAAASLKNQSYRLLERRMSGAEADENDLEILRRKLRNQEISRTEYDLSVRSYISLTVTELTSIANMAHLHGKNEEDPNAKPQDRAALDMLLEGIRSGNAVQLIQVMNPTINHSA